MTRVAAIIPVGTLAGAKSRLGESLDAEERQDLVEGFLARTVVAALAVDRLADVLVVSPDRDVLARAAALGARTLRQRSRGLNRGLAEARADVDRGRRRGRPGPADRPPVRDARGDRRRRRAAGHAADRVVVLVADRHGTGTNALGLRPPDVIGFAFGPSSRDAHRAAAEEAGATVIELDGPLTVDLDTPDDFVHVESLASEGVGAG